MNRHRAPSARLGRRRDASIEPLGGGITNRNFKVAVGGEAFVLRIGGNDTALLGIDRDVEHVATRRIPLRRSSRSARR